MNETAEITTTENQDSESYDRGYTATLHWLNQGLKGPHPTPPAGFTGRDSSGWWNGSQDAYEYFEVARPIRDHMRAQLEDLILHLITCILILLGVYLLFTESIITMGLGATLLYLCLSRIRNVRKANQQVNKE